MSEVERRRFPRIAHPFFIRYRISTVRGLAWRMAPLRDLSAGGARFVAEVVFQIGQGIELQLTLPNAKQPIGLSARVVWSKPAKEPMQLIEYGVEFQVVDPAGRAGLAAALLPFLSNQSRKAGGPP